MPNSEPAASRLLDDGALHSSSVVANNAMNRERQLSGVNSYARELGFDPVDRLSTVSGGAWLDLCCGSGRALIQAVARLPDATLVGVDLVDAFAPGSGPALIAAPVETWEPSRAFDLITCVHGLHYVGDKLGVLTRIVRWLTPTGQFIADLDLGSVQLTDRRGLVAKLRAAGLDYDSRRKRIGCVGPRELNLPYVYEGADDRAGSNYTGQPAVRSYYRPRG